MLPWELSVSKVLSSRCCPVLEGGLVIVVTNSVCLNEESVIELIVSSIVNDSVWGSNSGLRQLEDEDKKSVVSDFFSFLTKRFFFFPINVEP